MTCTDILTYADVTNTLANVTRQPVLPPIDTGTMYKPPTDSTLIECWSLTAVHAMFCLCFVVVKNCPVLPKFFSVTPQGMGQSYKSPSASEIILMNVGKYCVKNIKNFIISNPKYNITTCTFYAICESHTRPIHPSLAWSTYSSSQICKVLHKRFWRERQKSLPRRWRRKRNENIKSPQTGVT